MAHSDVLGGSSAARVINCPASVRLAKDIPKVDTDNIYTRRGTALHEVMEKWLLEGPDAFHPRVDSVIGGHTITADDLIAMDRAWGATQEMMVDFQVDEYEPEAEVHFTTMPGAFGTCDFIGLNKAGELVIADYKFGEGVLVSAMDNHQLMFYAGALLQDANFEDLWPDSNAMAVHLAIIQPAKEYPLDVWTTSVREIKHHTRELEIALELSRKDDTPPNAGDHCRFCPAHAVCPLKIKNAQAVNRLKQEHLNDLAVAMELADELEPWIRAVRKAAHEQLEAGAVVDGYKLVRKRESRKWVDEIGVLKKLKNMRKLKRADYVTEKLVTPPALEKLCKTHGVDFETFADYYDRVSSGTSVVPADDPRPGITRGPDREIPESLTKLMEKSNG